MHFSFIAHISESLSVVEINAFLAKAFSLVFPANISVFSRVRMTVFAVSFCALKLGSVQGLYASSKVFFQRHRFQVLRIDAASNATQVVDLQPLGYRALEQFVRYAMGELRMRRVDELSITSREKRSDPKPAAAIGLWNNFRHEPFETCKLYFSHVIPPVNRIGQGRCGCFSTRAACVLL